MFAFVFLLWLYLIVLLEVVSGRPLCEFIENTLQICNKDSIIYQCWSNVDHFDLKRTIKCQFF